MKLPYIIITDDDKQVLGAIQRDIRNKFREQYRAVAIENPLEALELIKELKLKNETVALFISDQRMPQMEGTEFLIKAREIFPVAKQVLLTAYSDLDAAVKAINQVKLDYYLLKPWSPPEEKLYPVINDLMFDWQATYFPEKEGIKVIGFQWSPKSHILKEFLSGNLIPYSWLDAEHHEEAKKILDITKVPLESLPLIVFDDGTTMTDPSLESLSFKMGLKQKPADKMYDVVIIGAGPAGLAASVYGSCEGLKTLLIEKNNPGGQASSSSLIENYLGFPSGLSGAELTRRALAQTKRFGTELLTPQEVHKISIQDGYKKIEFKDQSVVYSKSIIIACGIAYKQLDISGIEKFTGCGVYYGAAPVEAHACKDQAIYIAGGGNSACQAALHLAKFAREVNIVIRKEKLSQTAANYLVANISQIPNIKIITHTDVVAVHGDQVLTGITLKDATTGTETVLNAPALFIYIGAKPETGWIDPSILIDEKGFILTGKDLQKHKLYGTLWKLQREPYSCETIIPGIFVAGDVRSGALTGISSAVGEGSMAVRYARKYLQEI